MKTLRHILRGLVVALVILANPAVTDGAAPASSPKSPADPAHVAAEILADRDLTDVLERARALLKSGLTAGSGYGEVWIRDLNTFLEISVTVNPPADLRSALLTFFKFQEPNGDVPDGYIPKERASVGYKYRRSAQAPQLLAHKNTVETDQESSLVLAVERYVRATGDQALLDELVNGKTVRQRLEMALDYVHTERWDPDHGLVWGATTADWGDVQPEHGWGVELDANSHRACDIYDNALYLTAMDAFLRLPGADSPAIPRWRKLRLELAENVRRHLWDNRRQKFIPHLYLGESPFPKDFDEAPVYYQGGTAVALEAGLLSPAEIEASLAAMRANVKQAGASSIGLTIYPPYPKGFFKNEGMGPYSYQNGGDWCWFGGRLVQQLIRHGYPKEAYEELRPMIARVLRHGDFYEWWSLDNRPRGSKQYRGSAGVLGQAIVMLQAWAAAHRDTGDTLPGLPPGQRWQLVWHDEFDGTVLDPRKWDVIGDSKRRDGFWVKEDSYLDGQGHLILRTKRDGDRFTSGAIRTQGRFEHAFGYWVARCQLPTQPGHWPAFWLMTPGVNRVGDGGRDGTEVDIVEVPWRTGKVTMNLHWDGYGPAHRQAGTNLIRPELMQGFHTYALWWTTNEYVFSIDGREVWRSAAGGVSQVPEYLKLTEEIGTWGGKIAEAKLPDSFLVDYVRVYDSIDGNSAHAVGPRGAGASDSTRPPKP